MSMFISGINRSLQEIESADQTAARLGQQLSSGRKIRTPADDPATWLEGDRAQSTVSYLGAIHTGLHEVATNIRVADTTMQAIGQHLGTMQGLLKQASTYPAGDPNRQQLIASFNTLRQQIDQLVNNTTETGARNLMSDPAVNPQAGNIQVLVGLNGAVKTVHAQTVDTGAAGLNLPALNVATTDNSLQAALAGVSAAQSTLTVRRQGLGIDAGDISRYETRDATISNLYQSQADALTTGDPATAAVELQSLNVQRSLAVQTLAGINTMRSAVLGLLQ